LAEGKEKKKKGKFKAFLKAFAIILVISIAALMYGYISFEMQKIRGLSATPFEDWRSYVSYLMSKIPFVNRYIHYEPLEILTPSRYFEETLSKALERSNQILSEAENKYQEAIREEQFVKNMRQTVLDMKDTWKEKLLALEIQLSTMKNSGDLDKIVELFTNGSPKDLANTLASEQLSSKTIAAALSRTPAEIRAEIIGELAKIDPDKSASITALIGSVEEITKSLEQTANALEKRFEELANQQASIIEAELIRKKAISYINEMSSEEIMKMIDLLSLDENSVITILSIIDVDKAKELLDCIKSKNPELFQRVVVKGVSL